MDALQQMVRVLTPAEKRYFKLFANAFRENSNLVKLFDLLDTNKEIEDADIKKIAGLKNIAVSRSNLRKLILKSMRAYNEEKHQTAQLRNTLTDMEWLEGKGLVDEAFKEMRRADKMAIELELNWALPQTALLARRTFDFKSPDTFLKQYDELMESVERNSVLSADYINAILFNGKIAKYLNIVRTHETANALKQLSQLLVQAQKRLARTQTIRGRILMLATIETIYAHDRQYDKAFEIWQQIFAIYDSNAVVKENPYMLYVGTLANYCGFCSMAGRLNDMQQGIERLKNEYERLVVPRGDKQAQWKIKSVIIYHCACYSVKSGNHRFIKSVGEGLETYFENYGLTNIPEAINAGMLYYISYHITAGNYQLAHHWLNQYYQHKHAKLSKMPYMAARLMEVILFYEQKQLDIAETKAVNLYKTIMEMPDDMQGEHQRIIGTLLRRLCHWSPGNTSDLKEVKSWLQDAAQLYNSKNVFFSSMFDYYDVTGWLERKFIGAGRA